MKVLRNLIAEQEIPVPKIGTVEEFQGQERMIVLLSTVRSTSELVRQDRAHQLGFVRHPKRLNVAISRARAVLMVFGNPHLLGQDASWRYLIRYCLANGAYAGCDMPPELLEDRQPGGRKKRAKKPEDGAESVVPEEVKGEEQNELVKVDE